MAALSVTFTEKLGSFIKRQTSGTSSDNEWQRMTASDNKWYNEWLRVKMSDKEWQRMTMSDSKWEQWYSDWKRHILLRFIYELDKSD